MPSGPSFWTCPTISLTTRLTFSPSAAEIHSRRTRCVFDAHVLEHPLQHLEAAEHLVVAFDVVAVAGMAAADEHAVSAPGQRIQDELRIHAAGAHQPDDADVGGVLQPRHAGEVGGGVGAPVAEEGDDAGARRRGWCPCLLAHRAQGTPSISLNISSSSNRFCAIEPDGQEATQVPQPLQSASLMTAFSFASSNVMAV